MTKTELKLLPIDRQLIDFYQGNPGANLNDAATALLRSWSGPYSKDRSSVLIAWGYLTAEISPAGRYRVSVSDTIPLEAV